MTYCLFLDDLRDPSWVYPLRDSSNWTVCRSAADAQQAVLEGGCPEWISFDHDLGDNVPTGYSFARWLVDQDLDQEGQWMPKDFSFEVHSANPVGAANIRALLSNYLQNRS